MTETKTFIIDGTPVTTATLDLLRTGGLWLRNFFADDPRADADGADAFHIVLDLFEEHRARVLMAFAAADQYMECDHTEDVSQINPNTGEYRRGPNETYVYRCEECGAIGTPDGPGHDGGEAIDWGTPS
jgi:hypothetical protein